MRQCNSTRAPFMSGSIAKIHLELAVLVSSLLSDSIMSFSNLLTVRVISPCSSSACREPLWLSTSQCPAPKRTLSPPATQRLDVPQFGHSGVETCEAAVRGGAKIAGILWSGYWPLHVYNAVATRHILLYEYICFSCDLLLWWNICLVALPNDHQRTNVVQLACGSNSRAHESSLELPAKR
jgi:hypothetical protein